MLTNDDSWRRAALLAAFQRRPDPLGDVAVDAGVLAVGLGGDDGSAVVGMGADVEMQGHLAQEGYAELLRLVPRAAMAEDLRALAAMRAEEEAHVLDEAQHRHGGLAEHVQ